MSDDDLQRIRFTGARTGLAAISVKGHGLVTQGDVIQVSAEQAETWTTPLPMRNAETGTDWEYENPTDAPEAGPWDEKTEPDAEDETEAEADAEPEAEADEEPKRRGRKRATEESTDE